MDAGDLRVFEAVARLGGMNRAAQLLNTVQSNVTARIRALEQELGTTLFDRTSRGVTLTPSGQRLLPYAVKIARLLDDARRAARDDGTPAGPLQLGSLETTAAVRLSPLLTRYALAYPAVDLILRTGTSAEMIEAVLDRQLEGAFVCGPVHHPELAAETLFREEMVLLAGPGVRRLDDVLAVPDLKILILRFGCSYRQRLEEILARRGIVGVRRLEFGTIEAIIGCCAAGIGVTLLPRSVIEATYRGRDVTVHALPESEAWVETQFVRLRDGLASSALAAFLALARNGDAAREAA
jgi:LysR family transcriptional regulator, cell division regulator